MVSARVLPSELVASHRLEAPNALNRVARKNICAWRWPERGPDEEQGERTGREGRRPAASHSDWPCAGTWPGDACSRCTRSMRPGRQRTCPARGEVTPLYRPPTPSHCSVLRTQSIAPPAGEQGWQTRSCGTYRQGAACWRTKAASPWPGVATLPQAKHVMQESSRRSAHPAGHSL